MGNPRIRSRRIGKSDRPGPMVTNRPVPTGDGQRHGLSARAFIRVQFTSSGQRGHFRHVMSRLPLGAERTDVADDVLGDLFFTVPVDKIPQGAVVTSTGQVVIRDAIETWEVWGRITDINRLFQAGYPWMQECGLLTSFTVQYTPQGQGEERQTSSARKVPSDRENMSDVHTPDTDATSGPVRASDRDSARVKNHLHSLGLEQS